MKKGIGILTCAAILGAAVLSGCNKNDLESLRGKEIRFTTVSNAAATKTSYGEDGIDNGVKKQALDWVTGDVIRLASPSTHVTDRPGLQYADYRITVLTTGVRSTGTLTNVNGNGLAWGDVPATYTFYGVYPSMEIGTDGVFSASIPASQPLNDETVAEKSVQDGNSTITYQEYKPNMEYAYMSSKTVYNLTGPFDGHGYVTKLADGGPQVDIVFNPAFTAFEFNISSADEEFTVKKVELVGDNGTPTVNTDDFPLAGTFTMVAGADLTATDAVSVTNPGNSVSVNDMNASLTTSTGISFTLFTLPKDNTGTISLKVTIKTGEQGTGDDAVDITETGTVRLNTIDPQTKQPVPYIFKAGQKYRVNLLKLGGRWKIFFGDITVDEWIEGDPTTQIVE